jgi:hypothetical protein
VYKKKHNQFPNVRVHHATGLVVGGVGIGVSPSYMNITGSGVVDNDDKTETSQVPAESLAALTGTDMSEDASSNNSGAGSAAGAGVTGAGGSGVA